MSSAGGEQAGSGAERSRPELDVLLELHLPGLIAFVRARAGRGLRRREATLDLVQSACCEVLRDPPPKDVRGDAAFRHWLYLAAERKIADRARYHRALKRGEMRDADREVDLAVRGYSGVFTPSREAAAREELENMEGALQRLNDEQREVIVLARIVGLSHAEIAARLGKNEGAVRVMLHRALAKLALEMGPSEET